MAGVVFEGSGAAARNSGADEAIPHTQGDPLWRLPLWKGYRKMLDSKVGGCTNPVIYLCTQSSGRLLHSVRRLARVFLHHPQKQ